MPDTDQAPNPNAPAPDPDPTLVEIKDVVAQTFKLEGEIASLKNQTKTKAGELEELWKKLRQLNQAQTETLPLFDRTPAPTEGSPAAAPDESARFAARKEKFGTDLWQEVEVERLKQFGISGKIAKTLAEGGIRTIDDIRKLHDEGLSLTDVKGIGESAENKIHAALDAFWAEWGPADDEAEAPEAAQDASELGDAESIDPAAEDAAAGLQGDEAGVADDPGDGEAVEPFEADPEGDDDSEEIEHVDFDEADDADYDADDDDASHG